MGSKSPPSRTLVPGSRPFLSRRFSFGPFSTAKCEALLRNLFPRFILFTPFYELQITEASFVLGLEVDLIAAPNYKIYEFYQSLKLN